MNVNSRRRRLQDPILTATIAFVILVLLLFIVYPLISILKNSFVDGEGKISISSYIALFHNTNFLTAFRNTMRLGLVSGASSTVVGFIFAYTIVRVKSRFKSLYNAVTIMPIISPPFVLAFSAICLLGRRGIITHDLLGLKWDIYGFKGLVIVQTMVFFPMASMLFTGLMRNLDSSMEEAARNLGASRFKVFTSITIPMLLSGIANAFLLSFTESVTDFANPMILGGGYKTLASQIYIQAVANYDMQTGTAVASFLLFVTVVIFVIQKAWLDKRSYVTLTGKATREKELIDNRATVILTNGVCLFCSFMILLFYVFVFLGAFSKTWGVDYTPSLKNFLYIFSYGDIKPIRDTLLISVLASPICGVLSMVIAYLIVQKRFRGRALIEYTSMLGMAVPGTVFGLGYILSFNTKPLVLTNTLAILVIVLVMTRLPVGVRSGVAALRQIDPSIEEAAADLGANSATIFRTITIPLIKPAFFSSLVFGFIKSMTAVSAVVFLVSANYSLLTVRVMQYVDKGLMGYASALSTVLVVIVFVAVGIMYAVLEKMGVSRDDIDVF